MTCFKSFKNLIRNIDLFYSNEILRYNSTSQYKTITGGIISIAIIIAILVGFSQMIINTM